MVAYGKCKCDLTPSVYNKTSSSDLINCNAAVQCLSVAKQEGELFL